MSTIKIHSLGGDIPKHANETANKQSLKKENVVSKYFHEYAEETSLHGIKYIGEEDRQNAWHAHCTAPPLIPCSRICTDFFPDAEVADEKAALRLIDIKQCRLRLSQSSSDRAPPLLNLRADRSLSHDRPSSEKCSAPIHHHHRLSGYHNLVGQRSHTCVPIELSLRSSCKLTA